MYVEAGLEQMAAAGARLNTEILPERDVTHVEVAAEVHHLCAKHGVGEGPVAPEIVAGLRDTLRRGLVAFVGSERADELARECLPEQ